MNLLILVACLITLIVVMADEYILPYVLPPLPVLEFGNCGYIDDPYGGCIIEVQGQPYRFILVKDHQTWAYSESGALIGELPFGSLAVPVWIIPK